MQQLPNPGLRFGRLQSLLLSIPVLCALAAPAIIHMSGWATDPSFVDNRPPAPFPSSFTNFRQRLTRFIDDGFGLRAELIKLNVLLYTELGVSKIPNMIVGRHGQFFLKQDKLGFGQFRALDVFNPAELDRWIDVMERYQRWLASRNIAFVVVAVPSAETIYPELMPFYVNRVGPETRLDQILRRLRERGSTLSFPDLRPDLWKARAQGRLYNKYENHWNNLGGFIGYQTVMRTIPDVRSLALDDFNVASVPRGWLIPPRTEMVPALFLKKPNPVIGTEPIAVINNVPIVQTKTTISDGKTVLLYGDSFGDPGLLGYFRLSFRWSIYAQTAQHPFPREIIEQDKPDVVVYELAERFLQLPVNYGAGED
ncbi:MAG: alginate O-acetyltransferase complex protein AlgJ [Alphaproteobacteria bacterium]|jgi:hypothetical protein|nr:alginate O-acetyltransferase complex protein AlgJ [Alphaproteobacteria bacterium]